MASGRQEGGNKDEGRQIRPTGQGPDEDKTWGLLAHALSRMLGTRSSAESETGGKGVGSLSREKRGNGHTRQ